MSLLIATLTDLWDGRLARALHAESKLGKILDPWADKILVLSVLATLPVLDSSLYPWWVFGLIAFREVLVEGGRVWQRIHATRSQTASATALPLEVRFSGKVKTTTQMIFIHLALGLHLLDILPHPMYLVSGPILSTWVMLWLYLFTAAVTLWSGIDTVYSMKNQQRT